MNKILVPVMFVLLVSGCGGDNIWKALTENASSAKELILFRIASPLSHGVIDEVTKTVFITVPYKTSLSDLVATFVSTGEKVSVGGIVQISGMTKNDFSKNVIYTVEAKDGTSANYTVTVNAATADAKDITYFEVAGVSGTIRDTDISIIVPYGTDITSMVPIFMHTGTSVAPGYGIAVDFTALVSYTVKAYDGTSKIYKVRVKKASDTSKEITNFIVLGNPCYIDGATILITVPFGTSVASLIPTIDISGLSVSPASGIAADFTSPVTYTVTAADGTTRKYSVTAVEASAAESSDSSLKSITVSKGVLQPAFSSTVYGYLDAPIPFSDSANPAHDDSQSASVSASTSYEGARIQFNDNAPSVRESTFQRSNISVGSNDLTITVTAINGTKSIYAVNMYRAVPVYKTGQTVVHMAGDDGDTKRGVAWPNPRFEVSGGGSTVVDQMTGLEWTRSAGIFNDYNEWSNLISHAGVEIYSMDGWRLANVRELLSICSYGSAFTFWLSASGFSGSCTNFWSSTSWSSSDAWLLSIESGSMTLIPSAKSHPSPSPEYGLWMVRRKSPLIPETGQTYVFLSGDNGTHRSDSGVLFPSKRFYKNADGTITDNVTGLTWYGKATYNSAFSFKAALDVINALNSDSGGDWRLPNVNELMSILDYSKEKPSDWLGDDLFTSVWSDPYWSSTTDPANTADAYVVRMGDGSLTTVTKETSAISCGIWPVRNSRNAAH